MWIHFVIGFIYTRLVKHTAHNYIYMRKFSRIKKKLNKFETQGDISFLEKKKAFIFCFDFRKKNSNFQYFKNIFVDFYFLVLRYCNGW